MTHTQLHLSSRLLAVPAARRWTDEQCGGHLDDDARHVVQLLTTELVANAVLHGHAPLILDVDCSPGEVSVAVTDANPEPPRLRTAGREATSGRGIALVDVLATAWGHRPSLTGKTTWFRYALGEQDPR